MDNKGFGIEIVLIFIVLVFFALFSFYVFMNTILNPLLHPKQETHNYKNEYREYMRNIELSINE